MWMNHAGKYIVNHSIYLVCLSNSLPYSFKTKNPNNKNERKKKGKKQKKIKKTLHPTERNPD